MVFYRLFLKMERSVLAESRHVQWASEVSTAIDNMRHSSIYRFLYLHNTFTWMFDYIADVFPFIITETQKEIITET